MTNPNDIVHSLQATEFSQSEYGLTKREYFSAMALQGLLANVNHSRNPVHAEDAVFLADALINALNKEQ